MLPGGNGDALWIEYGDEQSSRRILVDGGTKGTWDDESGLRSRIQALPADERHFELLVVTHIDRDHIDGALALLQADDLGATYGDVWFNGFRHLPETLEPLGPVEGELLTTAILDRGLPWNEAFGGNAVVMPNEGALLSADLPGELKVTVLGPGMQQLFDLRPVWIPAIEEAGLDPASPPPPLAPELPPGLEPLGPKPNVAALAASAFDEDSAEPNGSSIVLLLEHGEDGPKALLTGDAYPSVVLAGVQRHLDGGASRLQLDAFKTPHHGSKFNVSTPMLEALDCRLHLFSSNGSRTSHPHLEAVGRTIASAGQDSKLLFNYTSRFNEPWADAELRGNHGYDAVYPEQGAKGISITLGED